MGKVMDPLERAGWAHPSRWILFGWMLDNAYTQEEIFWFAAVFIAAAMFCFVTTQDGGGKTGMRRIPRQPSCLRRLPSLPRTRLLRTNDVASFYGGRTVTIYVGYNAGGGYDRYSRTLARHIGRHIPGNPAVTVENRPGAGAGSQARQSPLCRGNQGRDVDRHHGRAAPTEPLFGNSQAKFDPEAVPVAGIDEQRGAGLRRLAYCADLLFGPTSNRAVL